MEINIYGLLNCWNLIKSHWFRTKAYEAATQCSLGDALQINKIFLSMCVNLQKFSDLDTYIGGIS